MKRLLKDFCVLNEEDSDYLGKTEPKVTVWNPDVKGSLSLFY